jgi:hypothetical protein
MMNDAVAAGILALCRHNTCRELSTEYLVLSAATPAPDIAASHCNHFVVELSSIAFGHHLQD